MFAISCCWETRLPVVFRAFGVNIKVYERLTRLGADARNKLLRLWLIKPIQTIFLGDIATLFCCALHA